MTAVAATWNVSLTVDCPNCDDHVDLLDDPDFWQTVDVNPCEPDKVIWTVCPSCETIIEVETNFSY